MLQPTPAHIGNTRSFAGATLVLEVFKIGYNLLLILILGALGVEYTSCLTCLLNVSGVLYCSSRLLDLPWLFRPSDIALEFGRLDASVQCPISRKHAE
jgi:hypothetical protein